MPIYQCPECGKKLKTAQAIGPGKKLKCPDCATIFGPQTEAPAKAKAPAAAPTPAAPPADPHDEGGGIYSFTKEVEDEAAAERRRSAMDPVKDRFEKSARGPAQGIIVKPSDWLLRCGVGVSIAAITAFLVFMWPL